MVRISCIGCDRVPEEIDEYVELAEEYDCSATDYVKHDEGTFDKFEKNKFYCTSCYIKAGMPLYR